MGRHERVLNRRGTWIQTDPFGCCVGGGSAERRWGRNLGRRDCLGSPVRIQGGADPGAGDQTILITTPPPVLQAGPDSISRCGPRTVSADASLQAMAFAMCPAVPAPTSWTAPRGGPWAAGRNSWHGPLWVVGLSCCMGTPSTVGLTAIACTQLPVEPCTLSWDYCCATLTATALNADGPCFTSPHPHPRTPSEVQDGTVVRRVGTGDCQTRPQPRHGVASVLASNSSSVASLWGPVSPICEIQTTSMWYSRGLGENRPPPAWKCSIKESSFDRRGCLPDLLTCQRAWAPSSH